MTAPNTVRQPSPSTGLAIVYLTVGVLTTIWASVWYYFLSRQQEPVAEWKWYVCLGLLFSGIALSVIGLAVGRIGREAQNADVPVAPSNLPAQPAVQPQAPVAQAAPAAPGQPVVTAPQQVTTPAAGS